MGKGVGAAEGGGRLGAGLREEPAPRGPPLPAPSAGFSGPPKVWPSSLPVSACRVPAPARRSSAVLPFPAPRLLSSSLDSAWGFAGFWEIKTASNSGGASPEQTGPDGPCAPGYRPLPPSYRPLPGRPVRGGGPSSRHPSSGDGFHLPKWGGGILEVSGSGSGAASVSRPGRKEEPVEIAR